MIDYQGIIDNLSHNKIKRLLYQLGAEEVIEKPTYFITNTICHNESGGSLKLYYYFNSHIFYCYTNCESMNIFTFMKHYYDTRNISYDWYNDVYKVILDCSNYSTSFSSAPDKYTSILDKYKPTELQELPTYPNGLMDCFLKYYPVEWLNDGITKETMDLFNIRYSIPQNKIIIPHYNANGGLVGIRGRALDEYEVENVGKYMPVQIEGHWYSHPLSLNLYGLNITKNNIKKYGYCFLVESEKAVMQMESFKRPNCAVAVCGSNFNKYALKLLIKECKPQEIIICFDNEESSDDYKYFNKLYTLGEKYNNYCDFSFIYDKKHLTSLKDSPTDHGEATFNQLLKERVKVR